MKTDIKVDSWKRDSLEDQYVYAQGNCLKLNIDKFLPKSRRSMSEADKEASNSLQTFVLARSLFADKIDIICQYIDYFIEFYDEDKELPFIYMSMKHKIDSSAQSMTINEFLKLISIKFFRDTNIKERIYEMTNDNYDLDVTVDDKSGRMFLGPNDFTNEEAKRLLSISTFMKMLIPVISQYVSTNTLYDKTTLAGITTTIFVQSFYVMGTYGDDDAEELLFKLYDFAEKKIKKHHGVHKPLWNQHTALRGLTEDCHVDTILIKHLLSNNMFKFVFNNNIMSFLKSIVETQLLCTINKVKYKLNPSMVDHVEDYQGLSSIDKLEQSMAKMDETQVIRCEQSIEEMIEYFENNVVGKITEDEVDFYIHNFICYDEFHTELIRYYFANIFDGYMELKNANPDEYIKLLIIAKRCLINEGFKELPKLLSSVQVGKVSMRILQNSKKVNKIKSSSKYKNIMEKKYQALKGCYEDKPLQIISRVINNTYSYVEYDAQDLLGETIEFDEDIIMDELLDYIDRI